MHNIICRLFANTKMDSQPSLTKNAVSRMLDIHKGIKESFIVQVSNFKEVPREKYLKLHIYDGTTNIKAIMEVKKEDDDLRLLAKKYGKKAAYTIEVIEHVTHSFEGNKVLEIMSFSPCEQLLKTFSEPSLPAKQQTKMIEEVQQPAFIELIKAQPAIETNPVNAITVIEESELRQFQRISDLYSDFQGWRIAVRVLDTCYKEFNSKSGKLTKIFTMFLTDRYGQKIEAAMFGDEAKDYHNSILSNQVYVISRGQIKESTYNHMRTQNQSRYIIIISRNSEISRIQDLKEIPKALEATMTIPFVVSDLNFEKQYEVVAILLQIGEEKTIEKEEKTIYKRSLIIGDPEKRKSMEAIIWGRNITIPENITGKTIILKHFRLNRYREMLSLCSTFKSQLIRKEKHKFSAYQGSQIEYQSISNAKETHKQVHQTSIYKSIRDLENELNYIGPHEAIFSDLQFWLTFINFKNKWYYEACNNPKCKKQTEHRSKCIHCGTFNEDILKKFILPIEITDFTGSLWTTAFDDFANDIFKDCKLELLAKLPDAQLKEEGEKRLYQQYKGRISTRKNEDGIIRHTIMGKPCELQVEKAMLSNIEKIKNALY